MKMSQSIAIIFLIHTNQYLPVCLLLCFLLNTVNTVYCVVRAQTVSINDIASVCHKLCGNGRKKLLSD